MYFLPLITLIYTNNKLVKISVISGEIKLRVLGGSLKARRNTLWINIHVVPQKKYLRQNAP